MKYGVRAYAKLISREVNRYVIDCEHINKVRKPLKTCSTSQDQCVGYTKNISYENSLKR